MLNSGEAAEKSRNKSEEKAYLRLYNLRNQKEKNNLLKTEMLNNNKNQSNAGKAQKRKTIQERDRYLQNLYKQGLNFMEKVETERTNKQKQLSSQMRSGTKPAWAENNKFFLEKVMQIFRNAMKHHSQAQERNLYEIDEENKFKEEEVVNENSDLDRREVKKFLFDIGFALFDSTKKEENSENKNVEFSNNDENQIKKEEKLNNVSNKNNCGIKGYKKALAAKKEKVDLRSEETKLVDLFVDSVFEACGEAEKVSSNSLFLYVIGILNLYDYFIYSSYKKTNPISNRGKENINNNYSIKNKKQKLPKTEEEIALKHQIIQEIKDDITKTVQKQSRYAGFDAENKIIITDENARNLKKDFHMFYLNFMFKHNIKNNKDNVKTELENEFKQIAPFKPKIDENSKKLYSDYRRKILVSETDNLSGHGAAVAKSKEITEYIDGLILRKKKKEK